LAKFRDESFPYSHVILFVYERRFRARGSDIDEKVPSEFEKGDNKEANDIRSVKRQTFTEGTVSAGKCFSVSHAIQINSVGAVRSHKLAIFLRPPLMKN
jgi:hypothetical protein